jgi:hypothetical protein
VKYAEEKTWGKYSLLGSGLDDKALRVDGSLPKPVHRVPSAMFDRISFIREEGAGPIGSNSRGVRENALMTGTRREDVECDEPKCVDIFP